jgi:pimeloyl-ACP methyl ester carboxylesterase
MRSMRTAVLLVRPLASPQMSVQFRRGLRVAIGVAIILLLGTGWVVWFGAAQLVQPPRGQLTEYSGEWLLQPAAHGIGWSRHSAHGGELPYLIVEPDAAAGVGQRGRVVREQITAMGINVRPFGEVLGTLVLLHGRTGRKEAMLAIAERFCAAGFRCVIPDLPAQGDSPIRFQTFGASADEGELARAVLLDAGRQQGFSPQPAGLFGMSMGGAYAVSAASRHSDDWRALVLLSTFDSLPTVIGSKARDFFGPFAPVFVPPIKALARRRSGVDPSMIVPAEWAKRITTPTLLAHGTADPLFPSATGRRLFDAIGSREKTWLDVEGGSHDRVLTTSMPLYATMSAWFLKWVEPLSTGGEVSLP